MPTTSTDPFAPTTSTTFHGRRLGSRVAWNAFENKEMYAHIARHTVTQENVVDQLDELIRRLHLTVSAGDNQALSVLHAKLKDAVNRKCLVMANHGICPEPAIVDGKPAVAYPDWVRAWAKPGWDGDIRKPSGSCPPVAVAPVAVAPVAVAPVAVAPVAVQVAVPQPATPPYAASHGIQVTNQPQGGLQTIPNVNTSPHAHASTQHLQAHHLAAPQVTSQPQGGPQAVPNVNMSPHAHASTQNHQAHHLAAPQVTSQPQGGPQAIPNVNISPHAHASTHNHQAHHLPASVQVTTPPQPPQSHVFPALPPWAAQAQHPQPAALHISPSPHLQPHGIHPSTQNLQAYRLPAPVQVTTPPLSPTLRPWAAQAQCPRLATLHLNPSPRIQIQPHGNPPATQNTTATHQSPPNPPVSAVIPHHQLGQGRAPSQSQLQQGPVEASPPAGWSLASANLEPPNFGPPPSRHLSTGLSNSIHARNTAPTHAHRPGPELPRQEPYGRSQFTSVPIPADLRQAQAPPQQTPVSTSPVLATSFPPVPTTPFPPVLATSFPPVPTSIPTDLHRAQSPPQRIPVLASPVPTTSFAPFPTTSFPPASKQEPYSRPHFTSVPADLRQAQSPPQQIPVSASPFPASPVPATSFPPLGTTSNGQVPPPRPRQGFTDVVRGFVQRRQQPRLATPPPEPEPAQRLAPSRVSTLRRDEGRTVDDWLARVGVRPPQVISGRDQAYHGGFNATLANLEQPAAPSTTFDDILAALRQTGASSTTNLLAADATFNDDRGNGEVPAPHVISEPNRGNPDDVAALQRPAAPSTTNLLAADASLGLEQLSITQAARQQGEDQLPVGAHRLPGAWLPSDSSSGGDGSNQLRQRTLSAMEERVRLLAAERAGFLERLLVVRQTRRKREYMPDYSRSYDDAALEREEAQCATQAWERAREIGALLRIPATSGHLFLPGVMSCLIR
ncbi:hypothetical protein QBC39DRAFT_334839 [Podospora conica]|nr:hypothetical protein QBC39DRAFT_334839 [Schizothecium conicum]